jgi:hypothetical protein
MLDHLGAVRACVRLIDQYEQRPMAQRYLHRVLPPALPIDDQFLVSTTTVPLTWSTSAFDRLSVSPVTHEGSFGSTLVFRSHSLVDRP